MTARRSVVAVLCGLSLPATSFAEAQIDGATAFDTRMVSGWTVHISRELLAQDAAATARALELLQTQLEEISHVVPGAAVTELQAVPLWISPEYRNTPPRAEYHPDASWLRRHGRDPAMAKAVEFTNVRIFEAETRRMPNFTLHELAHAYHDRVLAGGFANKAIKAAYEKAKASGDYDRVERRDSKGRKRIDRAYALTNPQEYFAESTEAFFTRNDFFPYTGDELKQHDPEMFRLLIELWGVEAKPGTAKRKTAAGLKQAPVGFDTERGQPMNGPLYLSAADLRRALPMLDAIDAMRDAFGQLSCGDVALPPRLRLDVPAERGAALIMPCHSRVQKLFSVKMVTVFDDNPQRGLPLVQATVILTDGATGTPLAIVDGTSLTAIRTGAASGLATDLLARADTGTVALIGAGVQARTQLEAVCCVRPIRLARVYSRNAETAERFAAEMSQQLGLDVKRAESASAAVNDADVICTATDSKAPVFEDRDLPAGAHVNAIGSYRPDMLEIPAATVRRARVVVDHRASALEEAGDLLAPYREGLIAESHFSTELGDVVLGRSAGRTSAAEITLFKSVGVAIQDLCAAARVLENARRLGIGTLLVDSVST